MNLATRLILKRGFKMGFGLQIDVGIKQVDKALQALIDQMPEIARRELIAAGERVQAGAKAESPVDTGNLRGSIRRQPVKKTGVPSVTIRADTEYAVEVHETNKNYKTGKWKYLEDPLKREAEQFAQKLADRFKSEAKGAKQ